MRGPATRTTAGGYGPAPTGIAYAKTATTAANTAQRLGTLAPVPAILDEAFGGGQMRGITTRPPNHVWIGVATGAANSLWVTLDNNTTPVVGGPGIEIVAGTTLKLDGAGEILLRGGKPFGDQAPFTVNALSAIQVISTAAIVVNVTYLD
jgi:hypothetical protein